MAPYGKWEYYNENVKQLPLQKNFAANKTKAVAWFVSNCGARNNRLKYAKELGKHIQVRTLTFCSFENFSKNDVTLRNLIKSEQYSFRSDDRY